MGLLLLALWLLRDVAIWPDALQGSDRGIAHGVRSASIESVPDAQIVGRVSQFGEQRAAVEWLAETWLLQVTVENGIGKPLAGAQLWSEGGNTGTRVFLKTADGAGTCVLDASTIGVSRIVSQVEGYEPEVQELPERGTKALTMTMRALPRVLGRLEWSGGKRVGPGYRVFAWPASVQMDENRLRRILGGMEEELLVQATTNQDGSFVLQPIPLGQRYTLIAGGPAGITTGRLAVESSPDLKVVEIEALYGVRIHVSSTDGRPLIAPTDEHVRGGWKSTAPGYSTGVRLREGAPGRVLIDARWLEMPELPGVRPVDQHLVLASGPYGPEFIESIRAGFRAPGYTARPRMYTAARLDLPPVDVRFPFEQVAVCWGVGKLYFDGALAALTSGPDAREGTPAAHLRLVKQDTNEAFMFTLLRPLVSPQSLSLPCGVYHLNLTSDVGSLSLPRDSNRPIVLEVSDRSVGYCVLDTSGVGAIDCDVSYADGERYDGPLVVFVLQGSTGDMMPFDCAPYSMEGFKPGSYTIRIEEADGRRYELHAPTIEVEVAEGQTAYGILTLPR